MRALALGLLAGVLWLQSRAVLPSPWLLIGVLAAALLLLASCLVLRQLSSMLPLVLLVCGVMSGAGWAGLLAHQRLQHSLPAELEGRDLVVTGEVRGLPDISTQGLRFRFRPHSAQLPDGERVELPGDVSLGWYAPRQRIQHGQGDSHVAHAGDDDEFSGESSLPVLRSGERWQLTIRLKRPHGLANPGGFDAEAWMLSENLRATGYVRPVGHRRLAAAPAGWQSPTSTIDNLRASIREKIVAALPGKPYAGVVVALVVGDQRAVSQKDWDIFARTGIGHLVSISGLHITMISGLFAALVHWLWRHSFFTRSSLPLRVPAQKAAALASLLMAFVYVAIAGFGIPAQRTLLMIAVVSIALWTHRALAVSQILCLALVVVLLCDPWSVLWPGFWLSFVAIACILYAMVGRADTSDGDRPEGQGAGVLMSLRSAGHTQWVVTLGLLPLGFAWFSQVSLVSPLANAIAIPLVSFAVTPLSLLGSLLPSPLSGGLLSAAHELMRWLADWLASLSAEPWAIWQAPQPDWGVFLLAMAGTLWALAPRGWPVRWAGLLCWLPLLLARPAAPEKGFWLTAFDIGQGNALMIETAHHRLIYDSGPAFSPESDGGSRVLLPYLRARGISAIDALVISHSDTDHSGGARSLWEGVRTEWFSSSLAPQHPLLSGSPPHRPCHAGQQWIWDDVRFEMLHPPAGKERDTLLTPNSRSCTLKISYGQRSVLLTGDIESPQERMLLTRAGDALRADVLLAPHHGSGTSSTGAFLDAVHPSVALFQVGYRNRYRHPKAEVVDRYHQRDILPLRTDQSGAVRIEVDEILRLSRYRCEHARYWSAEPCTDEIGITSPQSKLLRATALR